MCPAPPLPPAVQRRHLFPEQGAVQGVHQGLRGVVLPLRHWRLRQVPLVHAGAPRTQLRDAYAQLLAPLLRRQRLPEEGVTDGVSAEQRDSVVRKRSPLVCCRQRRRTNTAARPPSSRGCHHLHTWRPSPGCVEHKACEALARWLFFSTRPPPTTRQRPTHSPRAPSAAAALSRHVHVCCASTGGGRTVVRGRRGAPLLVLVGAMVYSCPQCQASARCLGLVSPLLQVSRPNGSTPVETRAAVGRCRGAPSPGSSADQHTHTHTHKGACAASRPAQLAVLRGGPSPASPRVSTCSTPLRRGPLSQHWRTRLLHSGIPFPPPLGTRYASRAERHRDHSHRGRQSPALLRGVERRRERSPFKGP